MAKNGQKWPNIDLFGQKSIFLGSRAKISRVNDRMKVYNGPLEYSWQLQRSFWPSDNENEATESNGKPQNMAKNGLKSTFFAKKIRFCGNWLGCVLYHGSWPPGGIWGCLGVF